MNMSTISINPRKWILTGFIVTLPTLIFWGAVAYTRLTHNPRYVDALLADGGIISRLLFAAVLPMVSILMAIMCRKLLQQEAVTRNLWHRETSAMRINQNLINWNVILISALVISLINN